MSENQNNEKAKNRLKSLLENDRFDNIESINEFKDHIEYVKKLKEKKEKYFKENNINFKNVRFEKDKENEHKTKEKQIEKLEKQLQEEKIIIKSDLNSDKKKQIDLILSNDYLNYEDNNVCDSFEMEFKKLEKRQNEQLKEKHIEKKKQTLKILEQEKKKLEDEIVKRKKQRSLINCVNNDYVGLIEDYEQKNELIDNQKKENIDESNDNEEVLLDQQLPISSYDSKKDNVSKNLGDIKNQLNDVIDSVSENRQYDIDKINENLKKIMEDLDRINDDNIKQENFNNLKNNLDNLEILNKLNNSKIQNIDENQDDIKDDIIVSKDFKDSKKPKELDQAKESDQVNKVLDKQTSKKVTNAGKVENKNNQEINKLDNILNIDEKYQNMDYIIEQRIKFQLGNDFDLEKKDLLIDNYKKMNQSSIQKNKKQKEASKELKEATKSEIKQLDKSKTNNIKQVSKTVQSTSSKNKGKNNKKKKKK